MKRCVAFFLLLCSLSLAAQRRPVYVIVHGAWGGSWAFKKVDSILTAQGAIVYRPSLTGQGERVHLASQDVGLRTHILDVVNTILYEDLHDVILVGHSYGGMVITGVADSLPARIRKLVYIDAFLPENGENVMMLWGSPTVNLQAMTKDGFLIPDWLRPGATIPHDVPQPLKTFTDSIRLHNPLRAALPATYILTVAHGTDPAADDFSAQAARARKKGWPVHILQADHNPQWSNVGALVKELWRGRL